MPMNVPALYSVLKSGEVRSAQVKIKGADISFISNPVPPEYSVDELDDRMPVVIADVRGLSRKNLDDRLLTDMRFPGSDIWFLTHIDDVEDVFDCFMGNVVKVLIPYHTIRNDLVMREVFEVTENCIPVLFVSSGKVICRGGEMGDITTIIAEMEKVGFTETIVFDIDSVLRREDWASLRDMFPGIIPFVRSIGAATEGLDLRKVIFDY